MKNGMLSLSFDEFTNGYDEKGGTENEEKEKEMWEERREKTRIDSLPINTKKNDIFDSDDIIYTQSYHHNFNRKGLEGYKSESFISFK